MNVKLILLLSAVGILSSLFHGLGIGRILPWNVVYSDVLGFYGRASAPGFPYFSKQMEYPVLTGLFIQFTAFLGRSRMGYYAVSALLLILAAALATFILLRMPQTDRRRLLTYWVFAPSMFVFLAYNWDMLTILIVLLAFFAYERRAYAASAACLAAGFSAKFFPLLYLPPLLLAIEGVRSRMKAIAAFVAVAAMINMPFVFGNASGWAHFFTLNAARGPNPDSIWAIISFYLFHGLSIPAVNVLSLGLFSCAYLATLVRFRRTGFITLSFLATLLFLFSNKVFSPQYLLWLLPFFVLIPAQKIGKWFYLLEGANLAAVYSILPWFLLGKNYFYFYVSTPFVIVRHLALIVILVKAFTYARREIRPNAPGTPGRLRMEQKAAH